jgi:hypothetical protein
LQGAGGKQQRIARRQGAGDEGSGTPGAADEEDAAVAEQVAELAADQHQAGVHADVADHHPFDRGDLDGEGGDDGGEGDVDHGVERHHQCAEADHRQLCRRSQPHARPSFPTGRLSQQRAPG